MKAVEAAMEHKQNFSTSDMYRRFGSVHDSSLATIILLLLVILIK